MQSTSKLAQSRPLTPQLFADTILPSGTESTFVVLKGPLTLGRFGRINFGEMQCWFDHEEFLRATERAKASQKSGGSNSSALREVLRDRLAIRLDWNDMSRLSFLHLPANARVEAFKSVVKAQPLISEHDARLAKRSPAKMPDQIPFLRGGGTQYWLLPVPAWFETKPMFLKGAK
jgi:hypothetical protein